MMPLLDEKEMLQAIDKMAHEIREGFSSLENLVLVGITSRGVPLARRLSALLSNESRIIPVGELDITLYRDDLSRLSYHPEVRRTEIPFSIDDKVVYLVDDVLFTGRTIRCALDALFDMGRPHYIRLAVLVDREGRELPIQADVVGIHTSVKQGQEIKVSITEVDGRDAVEMSRLDKIQP